MAPTRNIHRKTGPAETGTKSKSAKRQPVKATRRSATSAPSLAPPVTSPRFLTVGIGASAGGLEAMEEVSTSAGCEKGDVMAKKPGESTKTTGLRRQAEKLLLATGQDVAAMPLKDVQQLVHELQVHQIELDMQNDELRRTQVELEATRDRYVDLHDFSPTAHLTMDRRGRIVEANLRAATLLGIDRQELIGQPFARFFVSEDQDIFHRHCQEVLKTGTRQTRELHLRSKSGAISWVHLESLAIHDESAPLTHWRTALLDISYRKWAEQAKNLLIRDLSRSQQHFQALFNWTPSAVGISTVAEGRFIDVNKGFSRLTGYSREEVIGRTTLELGLWADPSERAIVLQEMREQGYLHNREGLLRTKSGEIRSLMVSVESIQLGADPCLIYLAHDITERKRMEEAFRLAKFSVDRAADAIYWIDPQAKVLDVNEAACRMLGYSKDELCAMTVHDLNPDFQADMWPGYWAETRRPGTKVIKTFHKAKDGRLIPIEVSVNFLSYEGKEYHCAFVRDITERARAEGELKKSEERYRNIFENAAEGIFQTTLDGKYVAVNPALARIYGYDSPDDMIAAITNIADQLYVDPERRDEFIRRMQSQKAVTGFEALVYRKDGSFIWISESARTLRDQAGTLVGYEGTVENITERKLGEERLRTTLEEVRMLSGRLATAQEEERTHIARELHDELGVRLTCLKIDLSRLASIVGKHARADVRANLNDKVHTMVEQVDNTIAAVQKLALQLRPALLDDLGLVAAIEWQSQDFQKRTGIPCTCVTSADDIAMEQKRATAVFRICQEALTNTARHAQATAVTIKVVSQRDSLQMVVADNGVGIPDTKVSDRRSLGLLGMQERAAQFGGNVTIEGDPEKGTTVTVCLPAGRRQPES